MTQLTYTIAHIKVGAEKYWEEVGGSVSGDKETLLIDSKVNFLYLDALKDALKDTRDSCYDLKQIRECFKTAAFYELKFNDNHPLSKLASKLGAKIYGGFEDEGDFYLLLLTIKGLKVGDVIDWGQRGQDLVSFSEIFWKTRRVNHIDKKYNGGAHVNTAYLALDKKIINNIFQEYARTRIIENDLYKQFFK